MTAPHERARRLRLDVARRLDGLLSGEHLGYLLGPGTENAEARLYTPGNDVRRIDWAVTARTGDTHVRDAIAERELETTLLVDLTASMSFGTVRSEKRELALEVAAAVLHLAGGGGDRVGAVVLGDRVHRLPPRGGRDAQLALLHRLLTEPRAEGTGPDLATGLTTVLNPPRRRGLVFVLSDLLGPLGEPAWARPLRMLASRHDVVVAEGLDPRELTLPDVGVLRLVDPETGRHLEVQTRSKALRERYARAAAERRAGHATAVRRAGAGHLVLRTDRDWLVDLATFLAARRRLRGAGRPAVR
ncbi:MAG: DUF58 domain-containing protein [Mycobacteriales bacterium]